MATSGRAGRRSGQSSRGALPGELVGTFLLLFFGIGAVLATEGGDLLAIALAFGLAVVVIVYAFGHDSGAHVNPAVTIALTVVGRFPTSAVPGYLAAQLIGGVLASIALRVIFGGEAADPPLNLGVTAPGEGVSAATVVLTEVIITFLLLTVIMATATDDRSVAPAVGLGVGLTVAAGIVATGPISGGSFNPVRSLAPMIVSGAFPAWLAYIVGPIAGGVLGALVYDRVLRPGAPPESGGAVEEQDDEKASRYSERVR